ncbi:MAG: translation elongation factor Ts [Candidatus Nanopelagicales bacterium]
MASITAADVKRLRDLTGAGMMECKRALTEADGDLDKAVEVLRISGAAKAAKRGAERQASNGLVAQSGNALVELRCETDFVAKNADFIALAGELAAAVDTQRPDSDAAFATMVLGSGKNAGDAVSDLSAIIGEKIELGRFAVVDGTLEVYLHSRSADLPPAMGVLLGYEGDSDAARAVALQIAAMKPRYLAREDVPDDVVANERRIAEATAREEGKPEQALPKIIEGRLNGFFKDTVLLDQPSVQENKKTVAQTLQEAGTTVTGFALIEVGQA